MKSLLTQRTSDSGPSHPARPSHARFDREKVSSKVVTAWNLVKKQFAPPDPSSGSSLESSRHVTSEVFDTSRNDPDSSQLPLEILNPDVGTASKHRRGDNRSRNPLLRTSTRKKKSSHGNSTRGDEDEKGSWEPVTHVVVDGDFTSYTPVQVMKSDAGSTKSPLTGHLRGSNAGEEQEGQEDETEDKTDAGSVRFSSGALSRKGIKYTRVYRGIVLTAIPAVKHFFDSSFQDAEKERAFLREAWSTKKAPALFASLYFVLSWLLTVILMSKPISTFTWIATVGVTGFFSIIQFPMVVFNFPQFPKLNKFYQPVLFAVTWVYADVIIISMYRCAFLTHHAHCGEQNFLGMMGFAFAPPTLAIFALRQNRFYAALGAIQWLVLVGVLLLARMSAPAVFYRNVVNFGLFHIFLIGTSFFKERSDRQLFALRQQLKYQYKSVQRAQNEERRASESKKRFVSYIFHEVRVPLNTALLAVQNLVGEKVLDGLQPEQNEMVHGLMGSLTMMEKVLNDVLSFNRMESGKFSQAKKMFDFHKSIHLVTLSHRVQAQNQGLTFIEELDKDINRLGGVFIGDEMRLRQVTSNLVSNSLKFTESGGTVRLVTKLMFPRTDATSPDAELDDPLKEAALNSEKLRQLDESTRMERTNYSLEKGSRASPDEKGSKTLHDPEKGSVQLESRRWSSSTGRASGKDDAKCTMVVVRVEVHDTGIGLRRADVIDNQLFSPYVQTEIGRRQGGKGSGLGLALVRQIVKLSEGRLGVESKFGEGSMFWFEMPYSLPPKYNGSSSSSAFQARFGTPDSQLAPTLKRSNTLALSLPPPLPTIETVVAMDDGAGDRKGSSLGLPPITVTSTSTAAGHRPVAERTESEMPLLAPSPSTATSSRPPETSISQISELGSPLWPSDMPLRERKSTGQFTDPFASVRSTNRRSSDLSQDTKVESGSRPLGALNALVVDDDQLTRMLMARMLTRLGHRVSTAENGRTALDEIKRAFRGEITAFDVIFLDNQMPYLSGVEVAYATRRLGCPVFIVGCTGNALREDQEEYLRNGADGVLPKPIHQRAVIEMIGEARRRVAGETSPAEVNVDSDTEGDLTPL